MAATTQVQLLVRSFFDRLLINILSRRTFERIRKRSAAVGKHFKWAERRRQEDFAAIYAAKARWG